MSNKISIAANAEGVGGALPQGNHALSTTPEESEGECQQHVKCRVAVVNAFDDVGNEFHGCPLESWQRLVFGVWSFIPYIEPSIRLLHRVTRVCGTQRLEE